MRKILNTVLFFNGGAVATYTISGTVYDADGTTAVASATVALGAYSTTSAANGTYTISSVPAGTSGSMTCTKTGYSWTAITVSAMAGNLTSQNYTNAWWAAGGCAAACVAAYQAYGAASQAASYVNLVTPGTHDLTAGSAPAWNSSIGWTFGGSNYLVSDIVIADTNVSAFACMVGAASQAGSLFGFVDSDAKFFDLNLPFNNDDSMDFRNAGIRRVSATDGFRSGVFGVAGKTAYINGIADGTAIGAGTYTAPVAIYIGCVNNNNSTRQNYFNKTIESIVIYNNVITAPQVAAVSAAMAALNP